MTSTQKTRMLPASSPDAPVYPGNGIIPTLLDEALKSSHLCPVFVPVVPGRRCSSPSTTHRTWKLSRVFFHNQTMRPVHPKTGNRDRAQTGRSSFRSPISTYRTRHRRNQTKRPAAGRTSIPEGGGHMALGFFYFL